MVFFITLLLHLKKATDKLISSLDNEEPTGHRSVLPGRLSTAREDQTEDMRDELSLLVRRFNNLEEALMEKDSENKELQKRIEDVQTANAKIEDIFAVYKDSFAVLGKLSLDIYASYDNIRITYILSSIQ